MRIGICFALCGALSAASLPEPRVADAVRKMDAAAVRAALAAGADINTPQVDGTTALHWAAHNDDMAMLMTLLGAKADVNAANRYGVTPLSLACLNGNGAMVERLLKAGANPNQALPGGESPLMTASRTGNVAAVRALLAADATVGAKDTRRGQTALMWAAAEGHVEVIEALLGAGADLKARVGTGFTAFLFAVREGRIGAAKALLKAGANVNEGLQAAPSGGRVAGAPRSGVTPLILAVTNAHYELASELLDAGADPNAMGPGYSALHYITTVRKPGGGDADPAPDGSGRMTSFESIEKLVKKGANINARMTKKVNIGLTALNTAGATPFVLAARSADAELMRFLAKLGADPNIPTDDGANAMIVGAGLGTRSPGEDAGTESEVAEALQAAVDLGVDINAVDKNGETAMHGAAYKNLPGAVEFLASHGAKIEIWNKKNKYGWTPLRIAEGYRFGNFKPSDVTVAAFHKVMLAAGVTPPKEPPPDGKVPIY